MDPMRSIRIDGTTVHEYYWAGQYPVYVNNRLVRGSYDEVVAVIKRGEIPEHDG